MIRGVRGPDWLLTPEFELTGVAASPRTYSASGMLSARERELLYDMAARRFTGEGFIIDAGSFFGSSTVSLAEGLASGIGSLKSGSRKPIVSYDIGFLPAPKGAKKPIVREVSGHQYVWGTSFVDILKANIAGHENLIDLRIGDFLNESWSSSDKIEICFVDLAKTNDLNMHVFRSFFPAFIPGKTLLIQQDFFFDRLPWIKVLQGYLEDYFEWLGQAGPSSLYRCTRPIPPELFEIDPFTQLPPEDRLALHKRGEDNRLSPHRQFNLQLSLAYLLAHDNQTEQALAHLDTVEKTFAQHITRGASARMRVERARLAVNKPVPGAAQVEPLAV